MMNMKLGVFDSGIGGESIAIDLRSAFPDTTIIVVNDRGNLPYGNKTKAEIIRLTDNAIQSLLIANCDIIILACNTATALAIDTLRAKYPNQKFIGIEPMIKAASQLSKSHTIAVCATPATLSSERYTRLIKKFGTNLHIIEPDCNDWAQMIEKNNINYTTIEQTIDTVCEQGADIIVLGCTHYHWIKDSIIEFTKNRAVVIEPSKNVCSQVKRLLKTS